MIVTASISAAVLCIAGQCYPALFGKGTPVGTFPLVQRIVASPGYGGDVMQYRETETAWYGVHRTYKNLPSRAVLYKGLAGARTAVTAGCINVEPHVYELVRDAGTTIEIRP